MKTLLIGILLCLSSYVYAQKPTITTAEAKSYIGKEVILVGKVVGTKIHIDRNGKQIMFINLDEKYPNNPVEVVIFSEVFEKIKIVEEEVLNKQIKIEGTLNTYKEKPQMIVQSEKSLIY